MCLGVMSKVAFKGIPHPYMAMLHVLSPSPYVILCIEQVSTIENVYSDVMCSTCSTMMATLDIWTYVNQQAEGGVYGIDREFI